MKYVTLIICTLILSACLSSERKEVTRRPPANFVAIESNKPQTKKSKKIVKIKKEKIKKEKTDIKSPQNEGVAYAITQGTMIMLDGGKEVFVPFRNSELSSDLTRQIMEIDERYFELFGGFQGKLSEGKVYIVSNDIFDQNPIYQWLVEGKTRYSVEIPEVARNRYKNEKYKYIALEVINDEEPQKKYYFHVDQRNIDRPIEIMRDDAKVVRVVMGNNEALNKKINQNLWLNESKEVTSPVLTLVNDTTTKPIQLLHLVKLYFSPQEEEFYDPKYEEKPDEKETEEKKDLVLIGRFTGEGIITGFFEKGPRAEVEGETGIVQYHFKQKALTMGRGAIPDTPTRMEIEFYSLKLGQDEDQLRLALQQAQFKRQQKLNVFFVEEGKRLSEAPDFSFSLQKMNGAAKLALIKRKKLIVKKDEDKYINPHHITTAILELDLRHTQKIIK